MHYASISSAVSLALALATGVALKVNTDQPSILDAAHWLARGDQALVYAGFVKQPGIRIKVSDRDAAYGYTHPACNGLLLLTAIPDVARTWTQLAPELDLTSYRQVLYYKRSLHENLPRWERTLDRLSNNFNPEARLQTTELIGLAEKGECGLIEYARVALRSSSNHSKGSMQTQWTSESNRTAVVR